MIEEIYYITFILGISLLPLIIFITGFKKLAAKLSLYSGLFEFLVALYLVFRLFNSTFIYHASLLEINEKVFLEIGFWLNNGSLLLLFVVALVSAIVRIYAHAYMKNDDRKEWFMALIAFFTFSMYGIIISSNLLMLFFFWEWVGLASYLMIGFWYKKLDAAKAAKKAFLYNKVGDLGFIAALGFLFYQFQNFDIPEIINLGYGFSETMQLYFGLSILIATLAKSAALPFSMWLSDAMEGPTPASALIHSATMVTAGVYLLIRVYAFLPESVLAILMVIGITTIIWSALIALRQNDIKKILAFSTVSQLGFMFLAIGNSNPEAAFFHLVTHAFFKSALFLSSGLIINLQSKNLQSQNLSSDPKDIRYMSGLGKQAPLLKYLFFMSAFALSALPFSSAFLSKEAILSGLLSEPLFLFLALLASFITALYSGRLTFLVFKPKLESHDRVELFKDLTSNRIMYIPIAVLSVLSFVFFYSINPFSYSSSWIYQALTSSESESPVWLMLLSILITSGGVFTAYFIFSKKRSEIKLGAHLEEIIYRNFYVDKLITTGFDGALTFSTQIVTYIEVKILDRIISFLTYAYVFVAVIVRLFDEYIIDGFVKLIAGLASMFGNITRQFQGGNLRSYLFWLALFVLIVILFFL